jgi:hypothetical protein
MPMPGTGGGHAAAGGSLLALSVILALFMIGYVLWTADHLTALARAHAAVTGGPRDESGIQVIAAGRSGVVGIQDATGGAGGALPGPAYRPDGSALAPRLAACYKIAMGIAMGYMLILML